MSQEQSSNQQGIPEQVRGAILAGIAALAGWSGITTVSLLIQSSSLSAHVQQIEKRLEKSVDDQTRAQQTMTDEIRLIRKLIEERSGGIR
jgi:3-hydroxyacyl-CoA dehydrogenase